MSSEPSSHELSVSLNDMSSEGTDKWPVTQHADRECVQRLIQQADMLVRETDALKPPNRWQHRKRKTLLSTDDTKGSSCDASSECTSDSVYSPQSTSASEYSDDDNTTLQAGSNMLSG